MTPYRPSNGFEAQLFYEAWCAKCARDKVMNGTIDADSAKDDDMCPIIAATLRHDIIDSDYPKEWVMHDDDPTCTAYTEHVRPGELSAAEKAAQGVLL